MPEMNNETVYLPLWSWGCQHPFSGNVSLFDASQEYPQLGPHLIGSGSAWCCSGDLTSPSDGLKPPVHQTRPLP